MRTFICFVALALSTSSGAVEAQQSGLTKARGDLRRQDLRRLGGRPQDLPHPGRRDCRRVAQRQGRPQRVPLHEEDLRRFRAAAEGEAPRGDGANAGIQFRTKRIPNHHEVTGYQADMGQGWWGALYDESRRNKVLLGPDQAKMKDIVKAGDWNDYVIRAEGTAHSALGQRRPDRRLHGRGPADRDDRRHRGADSRRPAERGVVQGHHDRGPDQVTAAPPVNTTDRRAWRRRGSES